MAALFGSPLPDTSQGWDSERWLREGRVGTYIGARSEGLLGIAAVTARREMNSGS